MTRKRTTAVVLGNGLFTRQFGRYMCSGHISSPFSNYWMFSNWRYIHDVNHALNYRSAWMTQFSSVIIHRDRWPDRE